MQSSIFHIASNRTTYRISVTAGQTFLPIQPNRYHLHPSHVRLQWKSVRAYLHKPIPSECIICCVLESSRQSSYRTHPQTITRTQSLFHRYLFSDFCQSVIDQKNDKSSVSSSFGYTIYDGCISVAFNRTGIICPHRRRRQRCSFPFRCLPNGMRLLTLVEAWQQHSNRLVPVRDYRRLLYLPPLTNLPVLFLLQAQRIHVLSITIL